LTNANSTGRLKNPGRWEGDSGCRSNGVTAARRYSPPARSPPIRPAAIAVPRKIGTLQVEIAKLETIVAGQRADLEILRYAKEPRLEVRRQRCGGHQTKGAVMRYKAKSVAALQLALGSLPDEMQVEVDPDIEVSAKTVGDLRKVAAWRANLAVITPIGSDPQSPVRVSKANAATRVAPKP
jgi:hypothetical protein